MDDICAEFDLELTWRMEWMVMVILMMALVLLRGGGAINRLYEDSITSLLHPT